MQSINKHKPILSFVIIFSLTAILYHTAFLYSPVNRDSGVFLYTGSEILSGNAPYRDVWDHKGPLLYLINALGVWLTPQSAYGTVLVEIILCSIAFYLLYIVLANHVFCRFSLTAVLIALTAYFQLHTFGNFEENFAFFGQAMCLFAFFRYLDTGLYRYCLIIGFSLSWCGLLRPNLIGLPIVLSAGIFMIDIRTRTKKALKSCFCVVAGALTLFCPILLFLFSKAAIADAFDQLIVYNLSLSSVSLFDRVKACAALFSFMTEIGVVPIALIGIAALFTIVISGSCHPLPGILKKFSEKGRAAVSTVIIFAFATEMLLNMLSLYHWAHYVIALIAISTILIGITLETVAHALLNKKNSPLISSALIVVLLLIPSVLAGKHLFHLLQEQSEKSYQDKIVNYIKQHTEHGDSVLVYGASATLNFLAGRRSPTRYVYLYPLIMNGYSSPEKVNEFLSSLQKNPPSLIVDTHNGRFSPLDESPDLSSQRRSVEKKFLTDFQTMQNVRNWIRKKYFKVTSIGNTTFYSYADES